MDKDLIKSIVRCAFKICFYYFLKCFLLTIDSYGNKGSLSKYEIKLLERISVLKSLVLELDLDSSNEKSSESDSGSLCSSTKNIESLNTEITESSNISSNKNYSESIDSDTKHMAYEKIKENITTQLKEKYGADTHIEFDLCDDQTSDKNNVICALKIKEMGKTEPDPEKFGESDIYVNTKTKTFQIKTSEGFHFFPLGKKSIVRYEKLNESQ